MQIVNLIDFSELLQYAKNKGYSWNETHKKLYKLYPNDTKGTKSFTIEDLTSLIDDTNYRELVKNYMLEHNVIRLTTTF